MANSARARSTCAAGALSERLRRISSWRSSAVSGRRGSFWWHDMGHLGHEDHRTTIPVPTADDPLVPPASGRRTRDPENAASRTTSPSGRPDDPPAVLIGAGTSREAVARGWCLLVLIRTHDGAYEAFVVVLIAISAMPTLIDLRMGLGHRPPE